MPLNSHTCPTVSKFWGWFGSALHQGQTAHLPGTAAGLVAWKGSSPIRPRFPAVPWSSRDPPPPSAYCCVSCGGVRFVPPSLFLGTWWFGLLFLARPRCGWCCALREGVGLAASHGQRRGLLRAWGHCPRILRSVAPSPSVSRSSLTHGFSGGRVMRQWHGECVVLYQFSKQRVGSSENDQ